MENLSVIERPEEAQSVWQPAKPVADVLAVQDLLLHRLCAISHQMRSVAVREILSEHDLDMRDWQVLSSVCELGRASQRQVTKATKLDKVAVNRASVRLKDRELVTVHPNVKDGRSHLLSLSPAGKQTVESCANALIAMERKVLNGLTQIDNAGLSDLLDRLADSIDRVERQCLAD